MARWESIGHLSRKIDWSEDDGNAVAEAVCDYAPAVRMIRVLAERELLPADILDRIAAALGVIERVDDLDRFAVAARLTIEVTASYLADTTNANLADWHFLNLAALAYLPPSIGLNLLPAAALTVDSPALKPFFELKLLTADDTSVWFDP